MREDVPSAGAPPDLSPCAGLSLSQDVFESVLREHVRARAAVQLRTGTALESFSASADGVTATVRDTASGTVDRVRARWLVAADGARSGVREQLGIALRGPSDLGRQRMVGFRADLGAHVGTPPRGIYFLTGSGAALLQTHPDHRWVLSVPEPGGPPDPADLVRAVLELPDLPIEVLTTSRWTAAAQSAQAYSAGPAFLVGDAAHRFPPAGATGVGTAVQDAHNLAWKLAAVAHGHAGPALLATYAAEREPVGRRNATETGAAWSRVFGGDGPPFAGRTLAQLDMGHQYRSAAVVADGGPDADPPGADYRPSTAPGCRAPHAWLDGGAVSTIDLFDRRFALLSTYPGAEPAAEQAARLLGVPVDHHRIDAPGWVAAAGTGTVLVRPDGHVAWRHDAPPTTTALVDVLAQVLDRPLVDQARVRTDTSHSRRASSGSTA